MNRQKQIARNFLTSFLATLLFASGVYAQDGQPPANAKKVASFAELSATFNAQKIRHESSEKNQTIIFSTRKGDFSGVIVVRWDQPNGVCHFIQTLPLVLEAKQVPSYLDAATRLNHGFLFPGLGMNPDNHGTYYRLSIPVAPRGYLYDYEVMTYTKFVLDKAVEFLPTLKMAVAGEIEGKDVVAKHTEQLRKAFAEQSGRLELVGKYTSEALDEKWTLTLSGNGRVELLRGSSSAVISSFSIADDTITFVDRSGVLASKEKGVYQFKLDGDELTFTLKEDDAVGRKKVLTTNPWKRITPAQPDAKSGQPKKPAAKQPSKDDEAEKDEPKSSDENPKSAEASK